MYVTIVMRLENADSFLEQQAYQFTCALAELSQQYLLNQNPTGFDLDYDLSDGTIQYIIKEAKERYRLITNHKINEENTIIEHCAYSGREIILDTPRKIIKVRYKNDQIREIVFKVDHYQWVLLNKIRPVHMRVEKRDDYWYGWLLGYCSENEYLDCRNEIKNNILKPKAF